MPLRNNRLPRLTAQLCALLVACISPVVVLAQAGNAVDEIVIRAQQATLDQSSGTGVYQGNAELHQGKRHLRADTIRITLEQGTPVLVEAEGNLVTLEDEGIVEARGKRLVYDVNIERIRIFEQAYVNHQGRVFEGAELEYDLQSKQVDARGGGEDGRVRLVIPAEEME